MHRVEATERLRRPFVQVALVRLRRGEAPDVDLGGVERGRALVDPLGQRLPGTGPVDDPLRVEPGGDVEVRDLRGLAEAEVHVGREGLERAQVARELGVLQGRDAPLRVAADRREVLPVRPELAERPVLGDVVGRSRPSPRLERADHQPAGVVPCVERAVERSHQRQQVVRALDRLGRDVDVLRGVERHRHADGRREVTGPQSHTRGPRSRPRRRRVTCGRPSRAARPAGAPRRGRLPGS